jgi:hypothetical protein
MSYDTIVHDPDLTSKEINKELNKLKAKMLSYIQSWLIKNEIEEVMFSYFREVYNRTRTKQLGKLAGKINDYTNVDNPYMFCRMLEQVDFNVRAIEEMYKCLKYFKLDELPLLMNKKEKTLMYTTAMWRLKLGV